MLSSAQKSLRVYQKVRVSTVKNLSAQFSSPRYLSSTRLLRNQQSNRPSSSSFSPPSLLLSGALALLASGLTYYYTRPEIRTQSITSEWTAPAYGGRAEFDKALPELCAVLSEDRVSIDEDDLKRHGYSEWATVNIDTTPIAIAYPHTTEEVSEIAKICTKYRIPMIGYSGGSSLEGNFSAPYGGVCIDFGRMDKILGVRSDDLDVTVQPGIGWMDLNESLSKDEATKDLFFPVDPGPIARIGGMVATCCSGTNCVRYGPMRNHILAMTVVLADGTIIKTRGEGRPRKSSAGYNLNHLFCGSEGTLGLVTEITLKLDIVPKKTIVASAPFPTVKDAAATSSAIIRAGIPIHCVELMDDVQMSVINRTGSTPGIVWAEQPTLLFKFSGTETFVKEQIEIARNISNNFGSNTVGNFHFAKNDEEGHKLWSARKEALWSFLALGGDNPKHFATDVCVPISKIPEFVEMVSEDAKNLPLTTTTMGHVGDGNLHAAIIYDGSIDSEYVETKKLAHNVAYRGIAAGGTCTGEHGIGISKMDYLVDELGPDTVDLMHTIKQVMDPLNLLNPGKVFTKESIERGREKIRNGTFGKEHYQYYKFEPNKPGVLQSASK